MACRATPEATSLLLPLPVTPRKGRSSLWAQPILHYERKRVLHSARRSGLHDEQREFFISIGATVFRSGRSPSTPRIALYVTLRFAHR
ncbi:MAG: hypothetical protein IJ985_01140 [Akkermansia sp.]|nr:hypothetical protein [Akkermansia sp.]